jgi:hypothetical protein
VGWGNELSIYNIYGLLGSSEQGVEFIKVLKIILHFDDLTTKS